MTIDVRFDSMEEFLRYVDVRGKVQTTFTDFSPEEMEKIYEGRKKVDGAPAEAQKENEPEVEAPAAVPAEEEKPKPTEALRIEARKILADLNKRTGKNTARELLTGLGYASLSKVPLEKLQGVIDKAREEDADAE